VEFEVHNVELSRVYIKKVFVTPTGLKLKSTWERERDIDDFSE
jgi:hypothetical protein